MSEFQTRWRWKTLILSVNKEMVELESALNTGWQPTKSIVGNDYVVFILRRDKEITDG